MTVSVGNADKIVSLAISQLQKIATGDYTSNSSQSVDFPKLAKMLTDLLNCCFLEICFLCRQLLLLCPRCNRAFENAEIFAGHYDNCDGVG